MALGFHVAFENVFMFAPLLHLIAETFIVVVVLTILSSGGGADHGIREERATE